MFGMKKVERNGQAQGLSDEIKRKISEVHLKIRSGDLSGQELDMALLELERMKLKLQMRMVKISAESARPIQGLG